ncbi:MAG: hypothetical protein IT320_20880 [Anaerolineae bacterium]|nr:hypothetical protein [Anaerolineae bacterium]
MTDLTALKPKTVALEVVNTAYGVGEAARTETVEIRTLSYHRWHEIGAMVTDPVMPETRFNALTRSKEPNPDDPDYRRELFAAQVKRDALRAADAIEGGGTPIPGDDLEDKAAWLADNLDAGVLNALIIFLRRVAERGLAQISARADSFQPVRAAGDPDAGTAPVDDDDVAEPAG